METRIKDLFNNIGKPQFAELDSIYDLEKDDIRELKRKDRELTEKYVNWKTHTDRRLLIEIVNEWCETYRCYSLHY